MCGIPRRHVTLCLVGASMPDNDVGAAHFFAKQYLEGVCGCAMLWGGRSGVVSTCRAYSRQAIHGGVCERGGRRGRCALQHQGSCGGCIGGWRYPHCEPVHGPVQSHHAQGEGSEGPSTRRSASNGTCASTSTSTSTSTSPSTSTSTSASASTSTSSCTCSACSTQAACVSGCEWYLRCGCPRPCSYSSTCASASASASTCSTSSAQAACISGCRWHLRCARWRRGCPCACCCFSSTCSAWSTQAACVGGRGWYLRCCCPRPCRCALGCTTCC